MKKINLCFVTDDYYAMPTCIAILSATINKLPKTFYDIYVLCKNVSKEQKDKLRVLESSTVKIKLIDIDKTEDYSNFRIEGIPATPTSIFKFYIPDVLDKIDKAIFIDGDTIIQQDLSELYNIDLGNKMIGVVKEDVGLNNNKEFGTSCMYFNSGVMLMDLKAMRQNECPKKLMEYRTKGLNRLMDQDAFNTVFKKHKRMIPFRYNTLITVITRNVADPKTKIPDSTAEHWGLNKGLTVEEVINDAVILHYITIKPWKYYDGYGNDIWYRYFMMSPYKTLELFRRGYYVGKIMESKSYKIGRRVTRVLKLAEYKKKTDFEKRYKKFLNSFCEGERI